MEQIEMNCEMALSNVIFMEGGVECRKIPEFPDYFAGSNGVIYSAKKGGLHPLKTSVNRGGYKQVCIFINGASKTIQVHRTIATTFHDNPENLDVVNHIDGNKQNNNIFNLEFASYSQNTQHAVKTKLLDVSKSFKGVRVFDITTGETKTFISVNQCADHFRSIPQNISRAIKRGTPYRNRYLIEFTDNNVSTSNHKESILKWRENIPEPFWIDGKMWMNGKECKQIPDFPDYFASPDGYIISNNGKTPIVRKPRADSNGYQRIILYKDSVSKKTMSVHRIIAITFIPNPENKEVVNHIDGNKQNNAVSNLEFASYSENTLHAHRTGLVSHPKCKVVCATDIITGETVTYISATKCAEHLGCARTAVCNAIIRGSILMKRYKVEYVSNEAIMINNNETSSEVMA